MDRARSAPFAALLVILPIYLFYGFSQYFEGAIKLVVSAFLSVALFTAFATLSFPDVLGRWARHAVGDQASLYKRALLLVALVLGAITHWSKLVLRVFYLQMKVPNLPVNAATVAVFAAFAVTCLALVVRLPRRVSTILWIVLAWGVCLRILGIVLLPVDPSIADMLFCIERSGEALLRGQNPYALTYQWDPEHVFPLVYFPLYWLPYVPFEALHLDLRWLNLLAQVGLMVVLLRLVRGHWDDARVCLVFLAFALMPDMVVSVVYRQTSLYWFMIALFAVLVYRERWRGAGITISALIAMQIPAFVLLFAYLLYLWHRRGFRAALLQGLMSLAFFALTFAPFLSVGVAGLKHATFDYLVSVSGRQNWAETLRYLSIGALAKKVGLRWILNFVQIAAVLATGAFYASRRQRGFLGFLETALFGTVCFLWFAPYVFIYYWFPAVLLGALICLVRILDAPNAPTAAAACAQPGRELC